MSGSTLQDRDIKTDLVSSEGDEEVLEVIADVTKALVRANDFFKTRPDWYENFVASKRCAILH